MVLCGFILYFIMEFISTFYLYYKYAIKVDNFNKKPTLLKDCFGDTITDIDKNRANDCGYWRNWNFCTCSRCKQGYEQEQICNMVGWIFAVTLIINPLICVWLYILLKGIL